GRRPRPAATRCRSPSQARLHGPGRGLVATGAPPDHRGVARTITSSRPGRVATRCRVGVAHTTPRRTGRPRTAALEPVGGPAVVGGGGRLKARWPVVLAYHRVTDDSGTPLCVSPVAFRSQLETLLRWGLRPSSLGERGVGRF